MLKFAQNIDEPKLVLLAAESAAQFQPPSQLVDRDRVVVEYFVIPTREERETGVTCQTNVGLFETKKWIKAFAEDAQASSNIPGPAKSHMSGGETSAECQFPILNKESLVDIEIMC